MPKRNIIWIAAIIVAALVIVWVARRSEPSAVEITPPRLQPVVDTYRLIEDEYYGPLEWRKLNRGTIRGMISALDEFSSYIPPEKLDPFKRRMAGKERGVGLRLEMAGGKVMVVGPLRNSPAHVAKIYAGDRLLAVDERDVKAMTLGEIELLLAGEVGSGVTLTLLRRGGQMSITLRRREFPVDTVTGLYRGRSGQWVHYLDEKKGIAYVRIKEFVEDTGGQFQPICRKLARPRGLVLDLRDNPGGYPHEAVSAADMFLTRGVIVTEISRKGPPVVRRAHAEGTYHPVPLVVLINGRTASAAEIVAGALGLHGRAVLVGTRTRGKHCGQAMYTLSDGLGQINLTTSQFLVGSDRVAGPRDGGENGRIEPHVEVALSVPELRELRRLQMRAEVVPGPAPAAGSEDTPRKKAVPPIARQVVRMDTQLSRAIKLLETPRNMDAILDKAAKTATTGRVRVRSVPVKDDD